MEIIALQRLLVLSLAQNYTEVHTMLAKGFSPGALDLLEKTAFIVSFPIFLSSLNPASFPRTSFSHLQPKEPIFVKRLPVDNTRSRTNFELPCMGCSSSLSKLPVMLNNFTFYKCEAFKSYPRNYLGLKVVRPAIIKVFEFYILMLRKTVCICLHTYSVVAWYAGIPNMLAVCWNTRLWQQRRCRVEAA